MPSWEGSHQIRGNSFVLEVDDYSMVEKSWDDLQYKKRFRIKISEFVNNLLNLIKGKNRPFAKVGGIQATNNDDVLLTDDIYHLGAIGINKINPNRKLEISEVAGTPPIRTTNMTSSSTDMIGTLKTVVVDSNGDFGVSKIPINSIRSTATTTTITVSDFTIVYTVSGLTQVLPSSVTKQILNLKNGSKGNLTITGNIDGVVANTIVLASKNNLSIQGDGTTWWII